MGGGGRGGALSHPYRTLPTLPRPQRCGLTRVCSAAAEADVSVVIQVTSTTTLNDRIQRLQDCHRDLTSFFCVSFGKNIVDILVK